MTGAEVLQLVETEIGGDWDRPTSHDLDLRRCVLRPPRRVALHFDGPGRVGRSDAWLVVAENPGDFSGYFVVFLPASGDFGLATIDQEGRAHHVGTYGTLWNTLEGM